MKKKTVYVLIACVLSVAVIFAALGTKENKPKEITKINVNEVVHSIFYAPQYVAIEKGFFEEEGLALELSVGQGADKSMVALISGAADIALMGTEAGVYVFNEGKEDFAVPFAQLTQRAGNYLISRIDDTATFGWEDVRGKTIIGGRPGGMPQMILEYVLHENGITPYEDVEIVNNLQFTSTAGAFVSGIGDYTAEFDPSALTIEKEGAGFVVRSLGMDSGFVPYTVYMAQKSYIEKNPETIQSFTNAVYNGQLWVNNHTAKEIAEVIHPYFSESSVEDLEIMVKRYHEQNTWKNDPIFSKEGFELLQDIMEYGKELSARIEFDKFINTKFAQEAVKNIK